MKRKLTKRTHRANRTLLLASAISATLALSACGDKGEDEGTSAVDSPLPLEQMNDDDPEDFGDSDLEDSKDSPDDLDDSEPNERPTQNNPFGFNNTTNTGNPSTPPTQPSGSITSVDFSEYSGQILNHNRYNRYLTIRVLEGLLLSLDLSDDNTVEALMSTVNTDNYMSIEQRERFNRILFNKEPLQSALDFATEELQKSREDNIILETTQSGIPILFPMHEEDIFFSEAWDAITRIVNTYTHALTEITEQRNIARNLYIIADNFPDFYKVFREVQEYTRDNPPANFTLYTDFYNAWNSIRGMMVAPFFSDHYYFVDNLAHVNASLQYEYYQMQGSHRSAVWFTKEESEHYLARYIVEYYRDFLDYSNEYLTLSDRTITEFNRHLTLLDPDLAETITSNVLLLNNKSRDIQVPVTLRNALIEMQSKLDVRPEVGIPNNQALRDFKRPFMTSDSEFLASAKSAVSATLGLYAQYISEVPTQASRQNQAEAFYRALATRTQLAEIGFILNAYLEEGTLSNASRQEGERLMETLETIYLLPYDQIFLKDGSAHTQVIADQINTAKYEVDRR